MTEKEIIRAATEYKKNKRQIEELEKANERIKALLVDELKERGGDSTLVAGQYKISQSDVKQQRINAERLRQELPSVWAGFVVVSTYKRLNINQHNLSIGVGYDSPRSFFCDVAFRYSFRPYRRTTVYDAYTNTNRADDNPVNEVGAPVLLSQRRMMNVVATVGWRF